MIKIASSVNVNLLAPRKKITILLIGNHSAGKSTFINWYIEEHILKTGVAIETQGFALVTSGRKRESLTGNATLHLYPHFKPLSEIRGLTDYLTTEISTSKQKKFSLVTFIDTPGLVDGDMNYPFDVEKAILFLGDMSDLIFVFFDPIGQALCKRTLNLVEALNAKHSEKIKMYLSKADEAGHEADRQVRKGQNIYYDPKFRWHMVFLFMRQFFCPQEEEFYSSVNANHQRPSYTYKAPVPIRSLKHAGIECG